MQLLPLNSSSTLLSIILIASIPELPRGTKCTPYRTEHAHLYTCMIALKNVLLYIELVGVANSFEPKWRTCLQKSYIKVYLLN